MMMGNSAQQSEWLNSHSRLEEDLQEGRSLTDIHGCRRIASSVGRSHGRMDKHWWIKSRTPTNHTQTYNTISHNYTAAANISPHTFKPVYVRWRLKDWTYFFSV